MLTTTLSVLIGLLVGTLYGMIQGYIIAVQRVLAFIVTLGSMWILKGLIQVQTEGKTIPANQPLFSKILQGYVSLTPAPLGIDLLKSAFFAALVLGLFYVDKYSGVPNLVLLLAILVVIMTYISNNTKFGRHVYAVGGNRESARLCGINITGNTFWIFVLMGFLCGVSGIEMASYVGYGTISAGQGYELFAIAACFLGGTSTPGGEGTIVGAIIGALIMASCFICGPDGLAFATRTWLGVR